MFHIGLTEGQWPTGSKLVNGYNSGCREPESYNNVYKLMSLDEVGEFYK